MFMNLPASQVMHIHINKRAHDAQLERSVAWYDDAYDEQMPVQDA